MPLYISMIFVSFVSSVLGLLIKGNRPLLNLFPVFLLLTLLIEFYSWRLSMAGKSNVFIYNLFTLVEFVFYLFFLKQVIEKLYRKINFIAIILVYVLLAVLNLLFLQGTKNFNTYTYLAGSLLIVIFCIVYFYFLFRTLKQENLARENSFWIITGLLFFYACSLPLLGITNFMKGIPSHYQKIILFTLDFSNILLNVLFTIGFLCKIKFRKLSRS